ncbi:MAG: sulfotransferase family protein [bacterium]
MSKVKGLLRRILVKTNLNRLSGITTGDNPGSLVITDQLTIEAFKNDPDNTFLVSFPRTGSHWLRMLMELYFGRPSLVRVFYYPEQNDYLSLHTHDLELNAENRSVIYLYRDPVDTIYSQLMYHKEDTDNRERIAYWSDLYGRHLDKWLYLERFTRLKTIVRYERLKTSPFDEFPKICDHFGKPFQKERFESVLSRVSKKHVNAKTLHDPQVINLSQKYAEERKNFNEGKGMFVWKVLLNGREYLQENF